MTATAPSLANIVLYCTEGGSNKEYRAAVEAEGAGTRLATYRVTFAFGRRGSTLQTGVKIEGTTHEAANQVWTKLVNEKMAKGYIPSPFHSPALPAPAYVSPSGNTRTSESIAVQLLEPIDDAAKYLKGSAWVAQPKYDGIRLLLRIDSGARVTAQNRKGLDRGFPKVFEHAMKELAFRRGCEVDSTGELVLDGEAVGERYFAFDLLRLDGRDLRSYTYEDRLSLLEVLFAEEPTASALQLTVTARGHAAKAAMLDELDRLGAEGAVFKHLGARYVGRRTDQQVKLKFWQSATVLVIARNDNGAVLNAGSVRIPANKADGKRSIQCAMVDAEAGIRGKLDGALVFVGDVTIPVNREMPEPGSFVELKYLYAHLPSRKMSQAQIIGVRDDVDLSDCQTSQLKIKQGEVE